MAAGTSRPVSLDAVWSCGVVVVLMVIYDQTAMLYVTRIQHCRQDRPYNML